eukprot:2050228-Pyramimonas_sp.AAC.1
MTTPTRGAWVPGLRAYAGSPRLAERAATEKGSRQSSTSGQACEQAFRVSWIGGDNNLDGRDDNGFHAHCTRLGIASRQIDVPEAPRLWASKDPAEHVAVVRHMDVKQFLGDARLTDHSDA